MVVNWDATKGDNGDDGTDVEVMGFRKNRFTFSGFRRAMLYMCLDEEKCKCV